MGATMQLNERNHYFIVFVMEREVADMLALSRTDLQTERFSSTVHYREYPRERAAASGAALVVYGSPSIAEAAGKGDSGVIDQTGGMRPDQLRVYVRDLNSDFDADAVKLHKEVNRIADEEFPGCLYYQLCCVSMK